MTYTSLIGRSPRPVALSAAFLLSLLTACGSDSGGGAGGDGGTGGTPIPPGCLVADVPGEPDIVVGVLPDRTIVSYPEFELRQSNPGSTVQFKMYIDADTRLVKATLMDAWRLRDRPQGMSETAMQNTATGDQVMTFGIPITTTGRYYVDVELCGSSCDEVRVVYTLNPDNAGPESDAINDPYERIVYKNGAETSSTPTCDNPNSIAIQ
jgi:hypothetical protein